MLARTSWLSNIMFKITLGLLEFPMVPTFTHPTRKKRHGHAYKFHQQRCCTGRRQDAFNNLPAKIVSASSVKSFKTLMDAHCQSLFPEVPIPSTHADPHPYEPSHIPPPLHLVVYSSPYCFVNQYNWFDSTTSVNNKANSPSQWIFSRWKIKWTWKQRNCSSSLEDQTFRLLH